MGNDSNHGNKKPDTTNINTDNENKLLTRNSPRGMIQFGGLAGIIKYFPGEGDVMMLVLMTNMTMTRDCRN
eukprot:8966807-Pyramimonas_sp.AAC.1